MTIPILILLLVAGYVACIWWAMSGEPTRVVLAIVALTLLAFGLRVVFPHAFPWGLHEDEESTVVAAFMKYCSSNPWGMLPNNMQSPLFAITIGPLYPIVGMWWATRAYSILASTFALPIAYGISRLLGLSRAAALGVVLPSLAALPWALLYGRSAIGGELILNGLMVIFTLLLILKRDLSTWQVLVAAVLLSFALVLCCLSYTPGKVELVSAGAAIVFAIAARQWFRAVVLALALVIAAATYNWIAIGEYAWYGFQLRGIALDQLPTERLAKAFGAVRAFWEPLVLGTSQSSTFVQMLPVPYLIALGIGLVAALRRREGIFLILWLIIGFMPGALGPNAISSHRLLTASILVPFVAAFTLDLTPANVRRTLAVLAAIAILSWGASTYFSPWEYQDQLANCSFDCPLMPPDTQPGRPLAFGKPPLYPLTCSDL